MNERALDPFTFIQQKSPTSVRGEMKAYWYSIQWGFKPRLNKVKAPADATDFQRKFIERSSIKSRRKYAKAHLIYFLYSVIENINNAVGF
ncbi:hypothetical protein [Siminovitchia terrae]|uniref:Uncharacterized protein n=2 Tax=Siminovitchia terrae TaxID=1914933 RepID=A0A429X7X1_SIMTE|nr:hypothetical protein [Siminovitchia terrae]RST59371.1 hypothetical protein D5F11_012305 [Siminovitchia terrae]